MTRCKNCCYNDHLKSSVYNPSGQRYELQLTAYNAMTNHLRRVLLAKSVVDCGNGENFLKKNVKYKKTAASSVRGVNKESSVSKNIIDRLAYDTKNHPHVSASMNWILNCNHRSNNNIEKKNKRSNSADSNEGSGINERRSFSQTKIYNGELRTVSPARKAITRSGGLKIIDNRDFEIADEAAREIKNHRKGLSRSKSEEALNVKNFRAVLTPCVASKSDTSFTKTPEFFRSTSKINCDKSYDENSRYHIIANENDENLIYVKFVYEITKEIIDRGYYEDRDIEMVFEKHVKRNFDRLKKEKMYREIKFLKNGFGMNCDYEDNEELNYSEIIKTENYFQSKKNKFERKFCQNSAKRDSIPESGLKSEIIFSKKMIDEKLIDDRDKKIFDNSTDIILSQKEAFNTLLDMNFDKEKADEIVKSLINRREEKICKLFKQGESKIDESIE